MEIDGKCELDDAGVSKVIAKEMKQRKESLEDFVKGGREDLAAQVRAELQFSKIHDLLSYRRKKFLKLFPT